MTVSVEQAEEVLQEVYGEKGVFDVTYKKRPLLGTLTKIRTNGSEFVYTVRYHHAQNRSRTDTTALAKDRNPGNAKFKVEISKESGADFDAQSIDEVTLEQTSGDKGAFVDLMTEATDGMNNNLSDNAYADLFRDEGAAIGQIRAGSTITGTTITLRNRSDITRVERGQRLVFSLTNGTGVLLPGFVTVDKVNRQTGVITILEDLDATIAGITDACFIFPTGDYGRGRFGLEAWIPFDNSGLGTVFNNVIRDRDEQRLAGSRVTGSGDPISDVVRRVCTAISDNGGTADYCALSPFNFNKLVSELDAKTVYVKEPDQSSNTSKGTVAYSAIDIHTPAGKVTCMTEPKCPDVRTWCGDKSTMTLRHLFKSLVDMTDDDGNLLAREGSKFAFDLRAKCVFQPVIKEPRSWGVGSLTAPTAN
jgi:hypothetical protein